MLPTAQGDIQLNKPFIYQDIDGRRETVSGRYVLHSRTEKESPLPAPEDRGEEVPIGFELAGYDRSRPLVIDPLLAYSTFLGGDERFDEEGFGIAVDRAGNAYVCVFRSKLDTDSGPN